MSFHIYCLKVSSSPGILVVGGMFLSQLSIESAEQIHFLNWSNIDHNIVKLKKGMKCWF